MLEKGEGPSPPLLLRFTHKEPKGVLRLPPPPNSTRRPRDKEASEMLVSTEPCGKKKKKPFDVPLLFEGAADRLEDFWMWCQEQQARRQLCARGGGSAQESKMAGEERKTVYQRRGLT